MFEAVFEFIAVCYLDYWELGESFICTIGPCLPPWAVVYVALSFYNPRGRVAHFVNERVSHTLKRGQEFFVQKNEGPTPRRGSEERANPSRSLQPFDEREFDFSQRMIENFHVEKLE